MTGKNLLIVFALLVSSSPALAQDDDGPALGTRLGSRYRPGTVLPPAQAAKASMEIARCIDDRKSTETRAYLLSTSPKSARKGISKTEVDCFTLFLSAPASNDLTDARRASIPEDILRGMLAEADIHRLHPAIASLQPMVLQPAYSRPWFAVTTRHVFVDEMATCIADTNPAGVASLLSTEPYSPQEGAAIGSLSANFGSCLRAGAKLEANRQSLRAAIAEALFQRLYAPAPVPPAAPVKAN